MGQGQNTNKFYDNGKCNGDVKLTFLTTTNIAKIVHGTIGRGKNTLNQKTSELVSESHNIPTELKCLRVGVAKH